MRNIWSKTVPYCKGVTQRRWCGHNRLSHTSSTFHPTIQSGRSAWASYLWEISTQQRYLISKRCATLKAHRHLQPFFISFQQACSSYFNYKLCNYSNLVKGLSILFMLKPLSHMHSCTLTHTGTHILREGKGVWKSHFLLTLGDLLTRLVLPGCTINTTKCQAVAVSSSS